jgi:hypothetical protein
MALNGVNGYLYSVAFAAAATSSAALGTKTWFEISAISTDSGLPGNLEVGDVFYNSTGVAASRKSGDQTKEATLTKLAFVTDVTESENKEKFEQTVQTDDAKSYQVGTKPEITGTVNGYFVDNNTQQNTLLKKFRVVQAHTSSGGITRTSPDDDDFHAMISYSEDSDNTKEVWAYKPMIIESLTMDKPMEGPVTFNFNYTENGAEKPSVTIFDSDT